MSKQVNISGEWFDVVKPRKHVVEFACPTNYDYTDIYQAYSKPSIYKVQIWEYWNKFLGDDVYRFGVPFISGRNCFSFTVTFNVYDAVTDEWLGVARITKDKQVIYLA